MFERLKRALVESFIGAIALGYLLAQCILNFVNIFASPIASWVSRKNYLAILPGPTASTAFSLDDALPEVARFLGLFLVWYLLMRWLYLRPSKIDAPEPAPNH